MTLKKLQFYLFIFLIILIHSGCILFRPSSPKLYRQALENGPYDVIIVPGVPYDGVEWSNVMKGRVIWGCYLIENKIAKNVIFSGGAVYTPFIEAKVMALYAEELGIPKEKIFIETEAQHSTENIYNSYCLAKKCGFTKIAVASDPFQSSMLMGFTKRKFDLPISHIPFMIDSLMNIDDVNPRISADLTKVENFKPITETQSKWFRFKGTLGKNIKFEKE